VIIYYFTSKCWSLLVFQRAVDRNLLDLGLKDKMSSSSAKQ